MPVIERITWDLAKNIVESGNVNQLGRSTQQLDEYGTWSQQAQQFFTRTDDYIKHVVFGWPLLPSDEEHPGHEISASFGSIPRPPKHRKWQTVVPEGNTFQIIFRQNDFPYFFHQQVRHYILWASRELGTHEIDSYLSVTLKHWNVEYIWFVNPPDRKTIKGVWHAHILIRVLNQ